MKRLVRKTKKIIITAWVGMTTMISKRRGFSNDFDDFTFFACAKKVTKKAQPSRYIGTAFRTITASITFNRIRYELFRLNFRCRVGVQINYAGVLVRKIR